MSNELKFLINLVKDASLLITDEFEIKSKGEDGDLVTNFDYEIEKYLMDKIKEMYPNFDIISEEFNNENKLTENCFTIDPIDGTINFANGIPFWGIQIACIKNNETCAAVIYFPRLDEMYYADKNGAFMNKKKITVNNHGIKRGLYTIEGPKNLIGIYKMQEFSKNYRDFHCAALNFAWVASGKLSATNFIWDTLWDYVPGQFIVKQAGGVIHNETKIHIAANNIDLLEMIKNNSSVSSEEQLKLVKKI